MADYSSRGIEKILQQAADHVEIIRCPMDGVVMRVLGGRAERSDGSGEECRFERRLPSLHLWGVRELDVECPACRRRAGDVRITPASSAASH